MAAPISLTGSKDFEKVRDELSVARDGGQPWFVLGEIYSQALATASDADHPALRTAASEATRLSAGVLRRYVVLLDRLRAIAASEGLTRDAFVSRVFNAAEVAARIYDLDREKGMTALTDLKAGEVTLAQLRDRLTKIPIATEPAAEPEPKRPSPANLARGFAAIRSRELKTNFMLDALKARAAELWEPEVVLGRRPVTRFYTSHQGFEIIGAGAPGRRLAGVELFILDGKDESELRYFEGVFPSYLVLATFYPRFHFAFSPSTPEPSVARAVELLGLFGAASIGIMRVTSIGEVDILVEPTGPPTPDRTASYDVLKK